MATEGRRRVVIVAVVAVLVLGLVLVLVVQTSEQDGGSGGPTRAQLPAAEATRLEELLSSLDAPDPNAEPFPAAEDPAAIRAWLAGDGAVALTMVDEVKVLWRDGASACQEVRSALDAEAPPKQVEDAIVGVEDEATISVLSNLYSSARVVMNACASGSVEQESLAGLAWNWAVAERRLAELGVER